MPLTDIQKKVLALLAANRSNDSHLAGATGFLMSSTSPRRSADLDLFHDKEEFVASAFAADRDVLEKQGYGIQIQLSQPGFIRAMISSGQDGSLRMDWAYDSAWRFMPPVNVEHAGFVLHPVDLAINKVLALIGRNEPRDFVDVVYLHQRVLPLGALAWAASGKDTGLNPSMILELLARRRIRSDELARIDLAFPLDATELESTYRNAIEHGKSWIHDRPAGESGCLYRKPSTALFFAPQPGEAYEIHRGSLGGVLPATSSENDVTADEQARSYLESFFEHRIQAS